MSQIHRGRSDASSNPLNDDATGQSQAGRPGAVEGGAAERARAPWGVWSLWEIRGRKDAGQSGSRAQAAKAISAAGERGDDEQWDAGAQRPTASASEESAWSDEELEQMQQREDEISGVVDPSRRADLIHASLDNLPHPELSRSGWGVPLTDQQNADKQRARAALTQEAEWARKARQKANWQASQAGLRMVENPGPEEEIGPNDFVFFLAQLDDVATAAGPMGSSNRPLAIGALQTHEAWAAMPRALRSATDPHSMSLGLWLAQARARASEAGSGAIVFCGVQSAEEEARQALRVAIQSVRDEHDETAALSASSQEEGVHDEFGPEQIKMPGGSRAWVGVAGDEAIVLREISA